MTLWNYSSIVHLSSKEIFVTGGLSSSASEISKEAYIYDSTSGSAVKLPDMWSMRYTHMSTFLRGKLYVIGGRDFGEDDDQSIRKDCERFNFFHHRWEKISRLNIPRCTGFVFVYANTIYTCGGLTGKARRSRTVERYDESNDRWEVIDFKLARGIECGSIHSNLLLLQGTQQHVTADDKIIILGGNTEEGAQDTCFIYDLAEKTVVSMPSMQRTRVL